MGDAYFSFRGSFRWSLCLKKNSEFHISDFFCPSFIVFRLQNTLPFLLINSFHFPSQVMSILLCLIEFVPFVDIKDHLKVPEAWDLRFHLFLLYIYLPCFVLHISYQSYSLLINLCCIQLTGRPGNVGAISTKGGCVTRDLYVVKYCSL